jgi:hypothetical protein
MTTHWLLQTHGQPLMAIQHFLSQLYGARIAGPDRADSIAGDDASGIRFVQSAARAMLIRLCR